MWKILFLVVGFLSYGINATNVAAEIDLFHHVRSGNYKAVKELAERQIRVNKRVGGLWPLFLTNDLNMAKLLLDNGASVFDTVENETPLIWAVRANNQPLVELFLDYADRSKSWGQNAKTLAIVGKSKWQGENTALSLALEKGFLEIAKQIVLKANLTTDDLSDKERSLLQNNKLTVIIRRGPKDLEATIPMDQHSSWTKETDTDFKNNGRNKLKSISMAIGSPPCDNFDRSKGIEIYFSFPKRFESELIKLSSYKAIHEKIWGPQYQSSGNEDEDMEYMFFFYPKDFELAKDMIKVLDEFEKIEKPEIKAKIFEAIDKLSKS